MSSDRIRRLFQRWLKITFLSFLVIISALLLLVLFLLVFRVPSFEIGQTNFWLLRWQNPPGVPFSLTWNLAPLFAIAAVVGFIRVLLSTCNRLS